MKIPSIIKAFPYSFFSKKQYIEVLGNWQGFGFRYVFILSFIITIISSLSLQKLFNNYLDLYIIPIVSQLKTNPQTIHPLESYYLRDPQSGKVIALVDPTGKSFDQQAAPITFNHQMIQIKDENGRKTTVQFQWAGFNNSDINRDNILSWIHTLKRYFLLILFPPLMLLTIALYLIKSSLFAVIALLISKLQRLFLGYQECLRLTVVAMTPALLLKAITSYFSLQIPPSCWVIITLFYIYFGQQAFRKMIFENNSNV